MEKVLHTDVLAYLRFIVFQEEIQDAHPEDADVGDAAALEHFL